MKSEFINQVPGILSAINRIAGLKASYSDFEYMATVREQLKSAGHYSFCPIINDIVSASKIGDVKYAASCARIFLKYFESNFAYSSAEGNVQNTDPAKEIYNTPEKGDEDAYSTAASS